MMIPIDYVIEDFEDAHVQNRIEYKITDSGIYYSTEGRICVVDISKICNILSYYDKIDHKNKISINLTDGSSIIFDQSKDEYKDFLEKDMDMLPDADKCRFYKFDIFKTEKGV